MAFRLNNKSFSGGRPRCVCLSLSLPFNPIAPLIPVPLTPSQPRTLAQAASPPGMLFPTFFTCFNCTDLSASEQPSLPSRSLFRPLRLGQCPLMEAFISNFPGCHFLAIAIINQYPVLNQTVLFSEDSQCIGYRYTTDSPKI